MELVFIQILVLFALNTDANSQREAQDSIMMRYIESRVISLEDRLYKCEQVLHHYDYELKGLSHRLISRLEEQSKHRADVKREVENLLARIERAEWDIDYLETASPSNTCVEMDEQLVETQLESAEEEKRKILQKLNTSCTIMVAQIKSQKTVKRSGGAIGSWIRNAGNSSERLYFFSGPNGDTLLEFANMEEFTSRDYLEKARNISLMYSWQGTGQAVHENFLFFHKNATLNEIVKYDLGRENVTETVELSGAGSIPPYQLSPFTYIDLAFDEQGLWSMHGDVSNGGNIVLTKINYQTMVMEHAWNTSCQSANAEAAFVICGTLYVVYNTASGGRSHIDCIYDTSGIITDKMPTLYFLRRYSSHASVKYNPIDQALYAWDEGYQTVYRLDTRAKYEHP
ncbi:olfactomedin-like protein 1 [Xenopus laevis]|uniref:Olfactomedin-like domain-containing protein n=2 Tax=Xenopus laevis TaxID=8355 RepID=A0A974HMT3_XENLA|nr:olfactomedin-like protein 1 [Xenopus laevis]OCT83809.1 hypothetical protein XELAEV_18021948mg [Xenopus laevis]